MNPILLIVWAALTACFLALLVYRGQLSRYEEERLFLGDEPNPAEQLHGELIHKLRRIEPFVKLFGGAAALATAYAVGIYVLDAWKNIPS